MWKKQPVFGYMGVMNKDYKNMTTEERLNDPDWIKMRPIERLHAIGVVNGLDGLPITLEEFRNGMSEEREKNIQRIREERRQELALKRQKAKEWLENHKQNEQDSI